MKRLDNLVEQKRAEVIRLLAQADGNVWEVRENEPLHFDVWGMPGADDRGVRIATFRNRWDADLVVHLHNEVGALIEAFDAALAAAGRLTRFAGPRVWRRTLTRTLEQRLRDLCRPADDYDASDPESVEGGAAHVRLAHDE